jgi:ubiquinone/menaquinone biosynthesis C-methylase UbiE
MSEQAHRSDPLVLNRRTLQRDHRRLAELLQPGMIVLDVGCGPGAITVGIAKMIGPHGRVVGIDRDDSLLATARLEHAGIENLSFEIGNVLSLDFEACFDLVTAARTLQWVSEPDLAILQMTKAARTGGRIVVLDYNHDDNIWNPVPPAEFVRFYAAFLEWRTENKWSNAMADLLPTLFQSAGLTDIQIYLDDEIVDRGDPDFSSAVDIWAHVIDRIGPRLVASGHLTEAEVFGAGECYRDYSQGKLERQTLSMRTVEGRVSK